MEKRKIKRYGVNKTRTIALNFMAIIFIGACLLTLPVSSRDGQWTDFMTALFTATSASCVTGLVLVDTFSHWSLFGQILILVMIQIGGLGTIAMRILLATFLRRNITLKARNLLQESINSLQIGGIVRLIRQALKGTILFEAAGAFVMAFYFVPRLGWQKGIYYSIFHAISAFCNAGFDLMGYQGEYVSFVSAVDHPLINIPIMALIILGGLGFIVWVDVWKHKFRFRKFQFHTKLVLTTTAVLVVGGAAVFYLFETDASMAGLSLNGKIYASFFASVTARTAGFNTVDTALMSEGGKLFNIVLMFIGGSPGSTAGGIKTTSIAVIFFYMIAYLRGKQGAEVFGRRISDETVRKAVTVFVLNLFLALGAVLIINGVEKLPMLDLMFEAFSAIGTVGMTTGLTRDLGTVGRVLIMALMFLGRVGSMSFAFSFYERKPVPKVQLPEIEVPVG
ncbi:Trk family potassium uptake protein [bacterium 1XD8-76]|nr:Trk family potassium uptake protein [bacterium 1XD8-76]